VVLLLQGWLKAEVVNDANHLRVQTSDGGVSAEELVVN